MILAAGGFESDPEWRAEHLGEGWENAKVRGTPYNTGDMIAAALAIGAAKGGDWGTCHSVQWDAFTPNNESNRELTNRLTRQSYPLGIIVNTDGKRFLDEGADFRNYTYAKYGKEILKQPGSVAYQIFDATLRPMLRSEEYDMPGDLGRSYRRHHRRPGRQDRTSTPRAWPRPSRTSTPRSTAPSRSTRTSRTAGTPRRAGEEQLGHPVETAAFYAYGVTCGITFTFGGLSRHPRPGPGRARRADPRAVRCGEMLGGLFSGNYPAGPDSPPAGLRPAGRRLA